MPPRLSKPDLFGFDEKASLVLLGNRCLCGYVFFPPQAYGCQRCGGTDLMSAPLRGTGTLLASALVHVHARPGRIAPFTIGTIRLDDGPILRALLYPQQDERRPGIPMAATLVPLHPAEKGGAMLDLCFEAVSGKAHNR